MNRAALGVFPPVSFLQDLKDALLSVSEFKHMKWIMFTLKNILSVSLYPYE